MSRSLTTIALIAAFAAAGCSTNGGDDSAKPTVVVTTSILGDVVANAAGDTVEVEVIMPRGASPHDFAPSAKQAEAMEDADLLVVNGAGFEEGMIDIVANVADAGTDVFTATDAIDLLGDDPHFWTDPTRVADVVRALDAELADLDGVDADALDASVGAYLTQLERLDTEVAETLSAVPVDRRVLVTNHEVFGYFAERYEFEVVGSIIPSLTTSAAPSAADLEALAATIIDLDVPAIFGDVSQSQRLAEVVSDEVGADITIVELYSESLGDDGSGAETYESMMRTNADLIAAALMSS